MGAKLPDIATIIQAGINPKNGLPIKFSDPTLLMEDIRKIIRITDEQNAVNKGVWYNLPCNITSQELERMLYYRGQLCFFYNKHDEKFYFMPYALDGTIDYYGRFNRIHPIPFTYGQEGETKNEAIKRQADYLSQLKLNCVYGILDEEEVDIEVMENSCVLLHDYTKQLAQTIIPRVTLNEPLIKVEAECIPFMRTSLMNATGVKGVRVADTDQYNATWEGAKSTYKAAIEGMPWVPITGAIEMQEITNGTNTKPEEFMLAMQSLDNLRLATHGLENGGLFEKKAHVLNAEEQINGSSVGLVQQDQTSIRQNFCNVVNSIRGLGIWYEPSENTTNQDMNGDGFKYDRNEGGENGGVEYDSSNDNEL